MKALIAIILLASMAAAHAGDSHEALVHLTAHAGASFALQTAFYGANSRWLEMSSPSAQGLAFLETMAIGFAYKLSENADSASTTTAMAENLLGSALAVATQVTFKF